jgi:hypothetical protein
LKRLLAWVAGAVGGLAAYRALKGKRPQPDTAADTRAEELKARLQEARAAPDDRDAFESGEVPVDQTEPPPDPASLDPGARRAQVHEQGRAALDEMRGDDSA